ncbi:hypothetical protein BC835DRAFT_1303991 [Cytidiella melzeri]|nr:hypothetical protein BC835DRAFT_1303991 [Cytidiella melzeri]
MQPERPGPLRDIPLARFMTEVNTSFMGSSPLVRHRIPSNKRPAPPEALPCSSPSKRRLLSDERGIAPSARSDRTTSVRTVALPENIKNVDWKAEVPADYLCQISSEEAPAELHLGHNETTTTHANPVASAALPMSSSLPDVAPDSSSFLSPTERVAKDTLSVTAREPQLHRPCYNQGSIHYPGFVIYRDPSDMLVSPLPIDGLPDCDEFFETTSAMDKENIAPIKNLPASRGSKGKATAGVTTPFSGGVGGLGSPLTLHGSGLRSSVQMTPLARTMQMASLVQKSPITPTSKTNLLDSPFLPSRSTSRRMAIGRSERANLRRQLTDEADGMEW